MLSIAFVILVTMIGWIKIDQNGLRQKLSNIRQELSSKIDKVSDRLNKIYTLLLKNK